MRKLIASLLSTIMRFTRKEGLIYGVGTLGEGKYNTVKDYFAYGIWFNMLERCYHKRGRFLSYQDCLICPDWHNFQSFADFYYKDEYRKNGWHLDKDILYKNNRLYCPEKCVFVPPEINKMLVKRYRQRGDTPIGVHYEAKRKRYKASMHNGSGKTLFLGRYLTPEDAFYAYKNAKESYIKDVADKYKAEISPKLYNALMNYAVDITD